MGETWHTFTKDGEKACDAVLLVLMQQSAPKIPQVRAKLDENLSTEIISSIITREEQNKARKAGRPRKLNQPFTKRSLNKFFELAMERILKIMDKVPHEQIIGLRELRADSHLDLGLKYYYERSAVGTTDRWCIPEGWIEKSVREIVEVLDLLNCDSQVNTFKAALSNRCRFHNFSVVAPTLFVQAWLIKRLFLILRSTDRFRDCSKKVYWIDVDSLQCFEYSNFLDEIIKVLETPEVQNSTEVQNLTDDKKLARICDCNLPTVLVMRSFQEYGEIIEKFTEGLAKVAQSNDFLAPIPKLIIFWADKSSPSFRIPNNNFLIPLAPLNAISLEDVTNWVQRHKANHAILSTHESTLNNLPLNSQEPYLALNQICKSLGVKEGMATIKKNWDLSA